MFERAQLSLTIVVVRRSSFSHCLHCFSLLFLKEYVGRSSGGGGVRVRRLVGEIHRQKNGAYLLYSLA